MEDNVSGTVRKKKRSLTCRRRPNPLTKPVVDSGGRLSKISSDDLPAFDTNPMRRKEFSLSHCISRAESIAKNGKEINTKEDDRVMMSNGESKKKVKVKISGLSRLVHGGSNGKCLKPVNGGDIVVTRSNRDLEESSDVSDDSPIDKKSDLLEGNAEKEDGSMTGKRKGKPAPKKRVYDSDDDSDDEIRFIEKLRNRNVSVVCNEDTDSGKKKTVSEKATGDTDYAAAAGENEEEVEPTPVVETTLTSRQRALASGSGRSTTIEFPDGLPPTTRKKKEILSATEQQLKKAEAAQRRKVQIEKAARESEAEAIRKILGQDSSRKKREDKIKKRLDERAQEKAAHEERASTSYIRTIMSPNGTTVSFPIDKVPSIFDPKPVCYPPPRETCAGPSCTNPYKYRHSKTNVPLCSLKCYKAVDEKQTEPVQEQESNKPVQEQESKPV